MSEMTAADRLTIEEGTIPIAKKMREDFPVRVTHGRSKNSWNMANLLKAYLNREKAPENTRPFDTETFIRLASRLTDKDAERIADFCTMHHEVFGRPGIHNTFCSLLSIHVLMKIYFYNMDRFGLDKKFLKGRIAKLAGDPRFMNSTRAPYRDNIRGLYDHAMRKMNHGLSKNKIEAIPTL
jgi:hypothetical protein